MWVVYNSMIAAKENTKFEKHIVLNKHTVKLE